MPTAPAEETPTKPDIENADSRGARFGFRIANSIAREFLIVLAFSVMTAVMTWPYVTRLRDAVVDPGDPYLVAWILWWDFHQTFTDPLNLFHANVFYPYRYTLAFSEHCYGLALPFFPLFALGARPLTVHAVALFFGFALSGYGAFRLARTLTGSYGAAWVSGIIFAFVPYRFHLMSHLPYLFTPWVPLLMEALVLFARQRSTKRAWWLGLAFFMTGLTTISWFTLSLVPLAIAAAILLTRYGIWRERAFWRCGAAAVGFASLALLPFMLPYFIVSKLYGFTRSIEEVKANSAWPIHWLSVENRNKLWNGLGENLPEGWRFKLFPGLLPILLSLAAVLLPTLAGSHTAPVEPAPSRERWIRRLDTIAIITLALSILAIGFAGTNAFGGLFVYVTSERTLALFVVALVARLSLAYPGFIHARNANLVETLRSERRSEAFWLGLTWTIVGFCYSLGSNFFFYRICYDLLPMFRSMRVPTRGAMIAYLGLATLSGLGARSLAQRMVHRWPRFWPATLYGLLCFLLLVELNAAPLRFMRGDVFPDGVTLRLKDTPMRGGIVVLPTGADFNHHHILRSADHAKPLIVGTSGFNSPYEEQIEWATRTGAISQQFMDLLEKIPTSYLVVMNKLIVPERQSDYETFLARAVNEGRLRFINRFDGSNDLYAVTMIEPKAKSEATIPFDSSIRSWAEQIEDDPVNILGQYVEWSKTLYRLYLASFGARPRYKDFIRDARSLGRGVMPGLDAQDRKLDSNLRELTEEWTHRPGFTTLYSHLDKAQYVDRVLANAGIEIAAPERAALVGELSSGAETRTGVLLKIVGHPRFAEREQKRSLVLLHYFGYFRRNPEDRPDHNLDGFNFWIRELERNHNEDKLSAAFANSIEYQQFKRNR